MNTTPETLTAEEKKNIIKEELANRHTYALRKFRDSVESMTTQDLLKLLSRINLEGGEK